MWCLTVDSVVVSEAGCSKNSVRSALPLTLGGQPLGLGCGTWDRGLGGLHRGSELSHDDPCRLTCYGWTLCVSSWIDLILQNSFATRTMSASESGCSS